MPPGKVLDHESPRVLSDAERDCHPLCVMPVLLKSSCRVWAARGRQIELIRIKDERMAFRRMG